MSHLDELPGHPGPTLLDIYAAMTEAERKPLRQHLLGTTSADWLSTTLRDHGHDISASTIRSYRRSFHQKGS